MNPDMISNPAIEPAFQPSPNSQTSELIQSYLDFEIHVAAGQAWLAMPGHTACRAMYPDHARALAAVMEEVAAGGGERRVHLAQDVSLLINRPGSDLVLIREDMAACPDICHALETSTDAIRLARRIRNAADRAERDSWMARAA